MVSTLQSIIVWTFSLVFCLMPITDAHGHGCASDGLCGPRSLLVICEAFGVRVDLDELTTLTGFDEKQGTSMLGLKQAAEAKGLRAVGMKIGLDELTGPDRIAIAHLWGNHFVVVEAGEQDSLKVTDPPNEPMLVSKQDFAKSYSGFALLVARDDSAFPKSESKSPDLRFDGYTFDFGFIDESEHLSIFGPLPPEGLGGGL